MKLYKKNVMKKIFTLLSFVALAVTANAQVTHVVIAQVYGAGGNTGATYNQDYVVLYNPTSAEIDMSTYALQYNSANGPGSTNPWTVNAFPAGTKIAAGKYFLIGLNKGTSGAGVALPTPDYDVPQATALALSGSNGKIVLTTATTSFGTTSQCPTAGTIIDFVGYGTTNCSETSPTGTALTATTAAIRKTVSGVFVDTDNNSTDFTTGTPNPLNSSFLSVGDIKVFRGNFVKNTIVTNEINFGEKANVKIYSVTGELVKSASVDKNTTLNVSSLPKGNYVVTGELNGETVSQKIVKQ